MTQKDLWSDKYRPIKPAQLIGKSQVKFANQLLDSIEKKSPIRKILFVGQSGLGKTTIAEMFIRNLLKLESSDDVANHVTITNCSSETGIDHIRTNVISKFAYRSLGEDYRVYFLDELHGLSKSAQNALLTPIENLPEHVVVIAATTEKNKIIETLKSRFLICELTKPTRNDFLKMAANLAKTNNKEIYEKQINEIIDRSNSNVRIFINYLQQIIDGSYSNAEDDLTKDNAFKVLLLDNTKDTSKVFKAIEHEDNYNGLIVRLCRGCITSIRKNSRGSYRQNCENFLQVFGVGLSPNTDEFVSFHKLLLDYLRIKS